MRAYRQDLAYIHDVGFDWFARGTAPGVLDILRRGGIMDGLVVDLGCGSGIWARELVRAGYEALGVDISRAMLAIARKRIPEATFRNESYLKTKLPRCDAVTSLGECFNYLFDEQNSLRRLCSLFRRVHAALRPGGLFIFDVAEPGRGRGPRVKGVEGKDWANIVEVEEDGAAQCLTRTITSFRKVGRLYRRDREVHRLRLYRASEMARELREVGFRVRVVRGYGAYRFPKSYVGFVARKVT